MIKKFFTNFEEGACMILIATMVFALTLQVFMRFVLSSSLAWTEELSRYSFIWSVYMGGVLAVKHSQHVRISAQFMVLPPKCRVALLMFTDTLWMVANFFIAYQSVLVLRDAFAFPEVSPTLGIVKGYVEAMLPASFLLMNVRLIIKYWHLIKNHELMSLAKITGGDA
ncbi:TRAP transporter small permease [Pseudodesulfovibrio thermohalotolerans]|jgi:TRAP-type C4-dicarboxylate transport system permease small subunit|uniref:TRAP transporter small permease n=1 Tax=Pseudodesulfovibrio thermohalotolerans TaxID=2880651 RepID=UPI002441451D|nr:TRAP transporter small permease [Pseudodesulfovibrio thermohalotolerans]WFS62801.1 TRAP transporter small permease [Pseudodesulfovibrio thermohalotolerans]